jgi:hypothetical protein
MRDTALGGSTGETPPPHSSAHTLEVPSQRPPGRRGSDIVHPFVKHLESRASVNQRGNSASDACGLARPSWRCEWRRCRASVDHQDDLALVIIGIGDDLVDQQPLDSLLHPHSAARRLPHPWQILCTEAGDPREPCGAAADSSRRIWPTGEMRREHSLPRSGVGHWCRPVRISPKPPSAWSVRADTKAGEDHNLRGAGPPAVGPLRNTAVAGVASPG